MLVKTNDQTILNTTVYHHVRHILSLSGGKDSTALALYMRGRVPNMEYIFCDTGEELQETYQYLEKLEVYLGCRIKRIRPEVSFSDFLERRGNFLPSPQIRWCTANLKIEPFEKFIGDDLVIMYIGLRADEMHRKGYLSKKHNIQPCFPFIEDGLKLKDIMQILEDNQLGLPEYYKWRSRSGCYFCFYQKQREWIGLLEKHPDLFQKAMQYERRDTKTGELYTWIPGESLADLAQPARVFQIKTQCEQEEEDPSNMLSNSSLLSVFKAQPLYLPSDCITCLL